MTTLLQWCEECGHDMWNCDCGMMCEVCGKELCSDCMKKHICEYVGRKEFEQKPKRKKSHGSGFKK
jgi:hypothetical protein